MLDLWLLNDRGSPEWGRQVTEERQVGSGGLGVRAWPCLELKACDKAAPLHGQSPPRLESPPPAAPPRLPCGEPVLHTPVWEVEGGGAGAGDPWGTTRAA